MASLNISRPSDLMKENLHRCNFKNGLFDSNKLRNIRENILSEISSKWESTFNESNKFSQVDQLVPTQHGQHVKSPLGRRSKMRSVYGQPEVGKVCGQSPNFPLQQCNWRSLDSLDTCDSGQGFGSNSTSCSDLRLFDTHRQVDLFVSDLGTSVESSDDELEPCSQHIPYPSTHFTSSGCSIEGDDDELETKYFMRQFVNKIFLNSDLISLKEKADFGLYACLKNGRLWFARYVTKQRNENKCVSESTYYSLAQYFAIILFECTEADDFGPAASLMTMCFTYYHNSNCCIWSGQMQKPVKQYLYLALQDQPIWRLIRFWNAAFFDTVQQERAKFFEHHLATAQSKEAEMENWRFQANVTFGQLGTFIHNMHSFGLPKCLTLEFVRKQSTIANLAQEQIKLLQDNIEMMYQPDALVNTAQSH